MGKGMACAWCVANFIKILLSPFSFNRHFPYRYSTATICALCLVHPPPPSTTHPCLCQPHSNGIHLCHHFVVNRPHSFHQDPPAPWFHHHLLAYASHSNNQQPTGCLIQCVRVMKEEEEHKQGEKHGMERKGNGERNE